MCLLAGTPNSPSESHMLRPADQPSEAPSQTKSELRTLAVLSQIAWGTAPRGTALHGVLRGHIAPQRTCEHSSSLARRPFSEADTLAHGPLLRGVSGARQQVIELYHVHAALLSLFLLAEALSQQPCLRHPLVQEVS